MNRFFTVLAIIVIAVPCLAFSSSELSWFEADFVSRSLVQGSLRIDDPMIPIPINCKLNQARNAGPFSGRCSRTLKSGVEFTWFVANRLIVRSENSDSTKREAYWPRDYFGFQMVTSDKFPEVYKAYKEKQPGFFASLFGSAYFRGRSDPNSYEISSVVDGVEISLPYSKPIISKTTVVSVNRDGEFEFKQDSPFVSTLACVK